MWHSTNYYTLGYKMRRQISTHLQNRAKTIRSAITAYNKAAAQLTPPRKQLKPAEVLNMVFLAQFDELRYARPGDDPSSEPWAKPESRVLTDKYFELLRAKEEVVRLNVEWKRLQTWMSDEKRLYLATIRSLRSGNQHLLASTLQDRWTKVNQSHSIIRYWLRKTQILAGFSGDPSRATAVARENGNPDILRDEVPSLSSVDSEESGLATGNDNPQDDIPANNQIENPDLLSSMIDAMGSICF